MPSVLDAYLTVAAVITLVGVFDQGRFLGYLTIALLWPLLVAWVLYGVASAVVRWVTPKWRKDVEHG